MDRTTATDSGPSSLAFAPNGRYLYVTHSISYTLATYSVLNGQVTRIGTTATGHDPQYVTVGSDGRFLSTAEAFVPDAEPQARGTRPLQPGRTGFCAHRGERGPR